LEKARLVAALRLLGVGFFIGGSIVLGVLGGLWLDDRLGTSPVLTLVGLFAGLTVAFVGVYEMLLPLIRNVGNKEDG
jgi:F0F1-type ATP synthase assembly protein I